MMPLRVLNVHHDFLFQYASLLDETPSYLGGRENPGENSH